MWFKQGVPPVQLPVLVTEYCTLGSYSSLLFPSDPSQHSRIKHDPATVYCICQQVLHALLCFADLKILHRAIEPASILLQGSSLGCCAAGAPPAAAFPNPKAAFPFRVKLGGFSCADYVWDGIGTTKCVRPSPFHAPELGCRDEDITYNLLVSSCQGLAFNYSSDK